MNGTAIIARGETPKVLQLVEASLDEVALPVERLVVPDRFPKGILNVDWT